MPERARALYAMPEDFEVVTALAIGYLGEIVYAGSWGQTAGLVE